MALILILSCHTLLFVAMSEGGKSLPSGKQRAKMINSAVTALFPGYFPYKPYIALKTCMRRLSVKAPSPSWMRIGRKTAKAELFFRQAVDRLNTLRGMANW